VLDRRGDDVVMIEHEFGIFGGPDGEHVLSLARELRVPMVLTLHTVLSAPSVRQAEVLRALCELATLVCVFTETAKRMMVDAHLAPPERVRVVPHGGPTALLPSRNGNGNGARRLLRGPRRPGVESGPIDGSRRVLSTFGLISPGKGIETAIAAMPAIVERHPEALYVVAGQTHPEVAKRHGEEYRLGLERQARDLGLGDHVIFDDRFLTIDDLAEMLAATTIYVTPYRSREQIVSGALTFAIVAGCPTVSTPYFYAEDLLGSGAGVIVPFDDPAALAEAVAELLDDPSRLKRAAATARAVGRELAWPEVGRQTAKVLEEAVSLGPPSTVRRAPPATLPRARTSHLMTLVDDVGIVQHADGSIPLRSSGYCVDDVARLAIVALRLRTTTGAEVHTRTLSMSLGFLRHAWDVAHGGMHNFLSYDRRWLDEPHAGDHLGRAAWALGEVLGAGLPQALAEPARILLCEMLEALAAQRYPRTMAFAILGLAHADPAALAKPGDAVLRDLAERLAAQQIKNAGEGWHWAEDVLAYDNARLPQALIAAGARLGDDDLVSEGLRALDWYASELGADSPFVRLVGHGWRRRGEPHPGAGNEQPLDAAALVEAEVEAFVVTRQENHGRRAVRAFEWFLGRNALGLAVYDFATGGCHDGLGEQALNVNEGAESTLAYLQALLALDAAGLQATVPE
jgi:glycosyltransferase involved in cell wall biosynthesis